MSARPSDDPAAPTGAPASPNDGPALEHVLDDGDSGFSERGSNEWTDSLTSSIQRYRHENGRTYHSYREGKYNIPNDERENDRLDLQNHLFMMTLENKLYLSPLQKDIHNAIDVGTGTGIWAIDFAEEHPEAKIVGTDLSPIQPSWVPPNLEFIIDDAEETWAFPEKFDFVHARMMVGSFASWPVFMENAFNGLRPGGWLELQDIGVLEADDSQDITHTSIWEWFTTVTKAFEMIGRSVSAAVLHKERMEEAGFEECHHEILQWPLSTWPKDPKMKELGLWSRENMIDALEALAMAPLTRILNWTPEEVQVLLARARLDLRDTSIHAHWNM
jgi:ubiquinone/menaquinone biosynthesis C-methylase UbiE